MASPEAASSFEVPPANGQTLRLLSFLSTSIARSRMELKHDSRTIVVFSALETTVISMLAAQKGISSWSSLGSIVTIQ